MIACFVGREGEAAGGGASLGDDAVVIVKHLLQIVSFFFSGGHQLWTYVYGNVDGDAVVLLPGVDAVVVLFGRVVAYNEGILGQLFEEAFWRGAVHVEVEGLGGGCQTQEREEAFHCWVYSPGIKEGDSGAGQKKRERGASLRVVQRQTGC